MGIEVDCYLGCSIVEANIRNVLAYSKLVKECILEGYLATACGEA